MPQYPPVKPPPISGWHFTHLEDMRATDPLGVRYATCDRCNHALRFIHWLANSDAPEIGVGACCAVRMVVGHNARLIEREAANRHARLMRFVNPARWRRNRVKGTLFRTLRGIRVTIFPQNGRYFSFVIDGNWSPRSYSTEAEALIAAFDAFYQLERTAA